MQGTGERTDGRAVQSGVHRFPPPARPPRCAASGAPRGWGRRPKRDVRMRERRKLGKSPPGSLPRVARGQSALGLRGLPGGVSRPHVSVQLERSPGSREAAKDRGLEGPRGQETVTADSAISSTQTWLPPRAPEALRLQVRVKCPSSPMQTSGKTLANRRGPSPRPCLSEGAGAVAPLESHLLERAPPLRQDCP